MEENGCLLAQLKAATGSKITDSEKSLLNDRSSEAINNLKDQLALALDVRFSQAYQTNIRLLRVDLEQVSVNLSTKNKYFPL